MKKEEEKSEYDLQAEKFLEETKTNFNAVFLRNDKYFPDDKEPRDIYEITLKRGERSYSFKFGQSIHDSGLQLYNSSGKRTDHKGFITPNDIRIRLETSSNERIGGHPLTEKRKAEIRLRQWMQDNHFSLSGLTYKFKAPTPYAVLASLTKNDPGTFENFCGDYGYDTDSIKALKIYDAVVEEWKNIKILYSDKEIEEMREIQ